MDTIVGDDMVEDREYIQSFFRRYSGVYDIIAAPLWSLREKVVEIAPARDGAAVLDVATGTGKQAFAFGRKGYRVTGIDLSEEMLEIARRKNRYANVKFESGDATSLPYPNDRFDITCISFALHDMPASFRVRVLGEMARVTHPEGRIIVIDYALPRFRICRYLAYHSIKLYESKYYPEFARSDLAALFRESGIRIEAERDLWFGTVRMYKGNKAAGG